MSLWNPPTRRPLFASLGRLPLALGLLGASACGSAELPSAEVPSGGRPARVAERIVPANSGAAELLLALIEPARLAALPITVEGYADKQLAEFDLPTFSHYTAENVLAFNPDLVVTHQWQSADATQVLERGGIPVFTLPDIGDFAGLQALLVSLGERVGAPSAAASLNASLQARFDRLQQTPRHSIKLVSYTNFGSGGWTAGSGTTADLLCQLAGVQNLSTENGYKGHQSVDFETLLTWNPDVFLVGASGEQPGHSPGADRLREEPSLATIEAIRHGRILVMPAELYTSNSHRIVDAAEYLARELDRIFANSDD